MRMPDTDLSPTSSRIAIAGVAFLLLSIGVFFWWAAGDGLEPETVAIRAFCVVCFLAVGFVVLRGLRGKPNAD